jgi:hypothetical protein
LDQRNGRLARLAAAKLQRLIAAHEIVDIGTVKLWWILGLALQGPSQTTEIDADRHACFFSRFVIFF